MWKGNFRKNLEVKTSRWKAAGVVCLPPSFLPCCRNFTTWQPTNMLLTLAVCVAARSGSPKTKGESAEVSLGDEGGKPPSLHLAAYHGACDALEAELERTQAAAVNQPDQKGISALQVRASRPAAVEQEEEGGHSTHTHTPRIQLCIPYTPQIAVARGHLCAVEALLSSGASPRQVIEEDGRTLLDFAVHAASKEGASAAVRKIKTVLEAAVKEERWL